LSYCEYDAPTFCAESYPAAKREYCCCECNAPILKGERHGKYVGKWDGELSTFRQHILCRDACTWIRDKFQHGECLCFGELKEYWADYYLGYGHGKYREKRHDPNVKTLRHMIAEIKWRERRGRP
jgi:hypothetical protein